MTITAVISFATTIVTLILGVLVKKFDVIESNKIPIQNALIGIIAGTIAYACGLVDNVFVAIMTCFISAMGAGGAYDLSKTRGGDNESK